MAGRLVAKSPPLVAFLKLRAVYGAYGGVLRRFVFLLGLVLFTALLRAATPLENARRAQALLGDGVWSQVIEIENAKGGASYPATVHALVFEFEGILWFYTDADGTQSFSLHRGRLAAEKADFAPLLREIEPGFGRWTVLPSLAPVTTVSAGATTEPLRNGCFIESVAAWRVRLAEGRPIRAARLLSYYINDRTGRIGHTVLAYEAEGRVEIFDPGRPGARFSFPLRAAREPLALAQALERQPIAHARFLALESLVVPG